jgi:tetratricopeptide (TPR) repeat protein
VAIDSLLRLGAIALRLQSYEEASAIFKSVLAKDPGNAEACLGLGLGCLHRSLLEDSAAWLEKACQFAGTRDRAICCLVSLLNRPSMIYQAQRYYDRLLDEYPEEPRLVLGYSRYLDILGDSKASESVLSFLQTLPNK